ncbi:MAG: hypothetical protein ACYC3I_19010 [Gemmataceae bacterium]
MRLFVDEAPADVQLPRRDLTLWGVRVYTSRTAPLRSRLGYNGEHEVHNMNEGHEHGSHSRDITISGGPGQPPLHFTPEEWQGFRNSDMGAGRSVVLLMGGIFTVGLVLYSVVAYVCWFKVM